MNFSDEINPDSWTEKELLKHLYREVKRLDLEIKSNGNSDASILDRLHQIEMEINRIDVMIEERDKTNRRKINKIAIVCTVIGLIISALALAL
jgi:predicted HNH restriction endonuclease